MKARFIQQVETQKSENISYDISLLVLIDFANTAGVTVCQGTTSFPGFLREGKRGFLGRKSFSHKDRNH
jgi:hypothetical protein